MLSVGRVPEAPRVDWPDRPYKGLNYFRERDAPLFAERERDIRDCGALVCQYSTRVLLLHGNSGAGKSSFLRAGLIPWLKQQRSSFHCVTEGVGKEPVLVRCTDDPTSQVLRFLLVALERDPLLSRIETSDLKRAKRELSKPVPKDRNRIVERITNIFLAIAKAITPTLVVVFDQSEDIFSSDLSADHGNRRRSFLNILENVCLNRVPIKIILSMRTEFYGRFSNDLQVLPRTNLEDIDLGFRQYLLRDLQTEASICAVIKRPTVSNKLFRGRSPQSIYRFTFSEGLPEQIAKDLVSQFGKSGTLPILQIICEALYTRVVSQAKRSQILMDDYTELGRAAGYMNHYIDNAIESALAAEGFDVKLKHINRWRYVLSSLVGRQGSGSVTTLIATEEELIRRAAKQNISGRIAPVLARMAKDDRRLLRVITLAGKPIEEQPQYSLGHDALAISLRIWSEGRSYDEDRDREHQKAEQKWRENRRRILQVFSSLLGAVILTSAIMIFILDYRNQQLILNRTTNSVGASDTPTFANKSLSILAALDLTDSASFIVERKPTIDQLRNLLARSPRYGAMAEAVGIDGEFTKLVFLDMSGKVIVRKFDGSEQAYKKPPEPEAKKYTSFPVTAVGFVSGLTHPVAYKNGFVYYFQANGWRHSRLSEVVPLLSDLPAGTPHLVDFDGGGIKVTALNQRDRKLHFYFVTAEERGDQIRFMVDGDVTLDRAEDRYFPTVSDSSNQLARLAVDASGVFEHLLVANVDKQRSGWYTVARINISNSGIARPLAFSPDGQYVALRNDGELKIFRTPKKLPAASDTTIRMGNWPNPITPPWPSLRPLLAVAEMHGLWRVAWPSSNGVLLGEGVPGKDLRPGLGDKNSTLYSGTIDIMRLRFSNDGDFLIAESKGFGGRQSAILVWDLTANRRQELDSAPLSDLKKEGCRIAKIQTNATLSIEEMNGLFGEKVEQPCQNR